MFKETVSFGDFYSILKSYRLKTALIIGQEEISFDRLLEECESMAQAYIGFGVSYNSKVGLSGLLDQDWIKHILALNLVGAQVFLSKNCDQTRKNDFLNHRVIRGSLEKVVEGLILAEDIEEYKAFSEDMAFEGFNKETKKDIFYLYKENSKIKQLNWNDLLLSQRADLKRISEPNILIVDPMSSNLELALRLIFKNMHYGEPVCIKGRNSVSIDIRGSKILLLKEHEVYNLQRELISYIDRSGWRDEMVYRFLQIFYFFIPESKRLYMSTGLRKNILNKVSSVYYSQKKNIIDQKLFQLLGISLHAKRDSL
ncbi:MAG: hypothetical protein KDD50_02160 [Bdellovibrionales bacterium]|nr:hypothetical protein [Bdellovibrionales bacterium]